MTNDTNKKRVLFVEDDKFYADMIAKKFIDSKSHDLEFEFDFVFTGDDAVIMLQRASFDIVLLDIMLPGNINGFGILEKMKSDDKLKKTPVIILSNLDSAEDIAHGMELGAYYYLVKSATVPAEVVERVISVYKLK